MRLGNTESPIISFRDAVQRLGIAGQFKLTNILPQSPWEHRQILSIFLPKKRIVAESESKSSPEMHMSSHLAGTSLHPDDQF